jgi:hypothetical protein
MEMACREDPRTDEELYEEVSPEIQRFVVLAGLGSVALHLVGTLLPISAVLIIAALISILGAIVDTVRYQELNAVRLLRWLLLPPLVAIGFIAIPVFLENRLFTGSIFLVVSLFFIFAFQDKAHPIGFYWEWLFTAPHLRPETRLSRRNIIRRSHKKKWRLLIIEWAVAVTSLIFIVVVLPTLVSPLSALVVLVVFAFVLNRLNPVKTWRLARPVLARYLAYGANASGAPGVWVPKIGIRERHRGLAGIVFLFYVAISIGTFVYLPLDAAAAGGTNKTHAGLEHIRTTIGSSFSQLRRTRSLGLGSSEEPSPQTLLQGFFYWVFLPIGCSLLIPPLLVLGLFRSSLVWCKRLSREVEQLDRDGRTMWQCYVDRIRESQHCTIDPFGNQVWESHHLFLGLEPTLKFPVLVDKRILGEHCYMVGQTGSGKTSLGIMPLLIQLIRGHNLSEWRGVWHQVHDLVEDFARNCEQVIANIRESAESDETENKEPSPAEAVIDVLRNYFEPKFSRKDEGYNALLRFFCEELETVLAGSIDQQETAEAALNRLLKFCEKRRAELLTNPRPPEVLRMIHSGETKSPPVPVVIIDLKGDPALFHTARIEAERRGQKFLYFTLEQGKSTFLFNPFQGFDSAHRSLIQLCNLFLDALSLNHGDAYGRSYYSRQARMLLFDALEDEKQPRTFPDLFKVIKELSGRDKYRDAYELLSTIHALQQYPQLITSEEQTVNEQDKNVIHMPRVIDEAQVIYFWLPAAIESISVREVGKLALFCLLSAAIDRQREGKSPRQTYLFIDEFQRIAGENLKIILEQARSFGISAILANQTLSDLKMADWDLRPTIRTNTRLQLYFSVTDPVEVQMLSEMSGEELIRSKSWTTSTGQMGWAWNRQIQQSHSHGWKEEFKNRLTVNDIARISDHPLEMIAFISRGDGYTQFGGLPFPVRSDWPISAQEYAERKSAPWPRDGVVLNSPDRSPRDRDKEANRQLRSDVRELIQDAFMREIRQARQDEMLE